MERLTSREPRVSGIPGVCCTHFTGPECQTLGGCCTEGCPWEDAVWERLAAYEDTGLTPEEIRCLLQTGAGGPYKKLPCKEGDPVWWINVAWLPGNGPMFYKIDSGKFRFAMLDWQNPIYTSQADVEAALAEMAGTAKKRKRGSKDNAAAELHDQG